LIDSRYLTQKGFTGFSVFVVKGKFYRKIDGLANKAIYTRNIDLLKLSRDACFSTEIASSQ